MSRIRSETLKELLKRALGTRPEEGECEICYDKLDQFAEMELEGKDPSEALPLLKKHLESCQSCNEEYKALLTALQELEAE